MKEDNYISEKWLRDFDRQQSKIEYDGPKWKWPVDKLKMENKNETIHTKNTTRNILQKS